MVTAILVPNIFWFNNNQNVLVQDILEEISNTNSKAKPKTPAAPLKKSTKLAEWLANASLCEKLTFYQNTLLHALLSQKILELFYICEAKAS